MKEGRQVGRQVSRQVATLIAKGPQQKHNCPTQPPDQTIEWKNHDPLLLLTASFLSAKTFIKICTCIIIIIIIYFLKVTKRFFLILKKKEKKRETIENKGAFFTGGFLLPPNWLTQLKPWFNHLQKGLLLGRQQKKVTQLITMVSQGTRTGQHWFELGHKGCMTIV